MEFEWNETFGYYNTSVGAYFGALGGNADPFLSVDFQDIDDKKKTTGSVVEQIGAELTKGGTYSVPGAGTYNTLHLTVNTGVNTLWGSFNQEFLGGNKWIEHVYAVNGSMAQALLGATAVLHELAHVVYFMQYWNPGVTFSLYGPGLGADGGKASQANQTKVFNNCTSVWMADHLPKR